MDIKALNYGYDLDCGGHTFEKAPEALGGAVVTLDDPDFDYFPIERPDDYYGLSCPFLAFAPNSGHFEAHEFPEEVEINGEMYFKVCEGQMYGSDRECHCHGKLVEWTGAAGEPREPVGTEAIQWMASGKVRVDEDARSAEKLYFEHTGNTSDLPYPSCDRCEGDGYVDSPGGEWAIYAIKPEEDED